MYSTRTAVGTTFCGVILDNGRDCPGQVDPDSPLNLCNAHYEAAFEWYRQEMMPVSDRVRCDICGRPTGIPGRTGGYSCSVCGYTTTDNVDPMPDDRRDLSERFPPAPKGHPVVYYLAFADRVKIGTSTDFRSRRKGIPHDEVLAVEPGGESLEAKRHSEWAHTRITGEWFQRTPELMAHIASLDPNREGWARRLRAIEGKNW